jgi:hypothetical protein
MNDVIPFPFIPDIHDVVDVDDVPTAAAAAASLAASRSKFSFESSTHAPPLSCLRCAGVDDVPTRVDVDPGAPLTPPSRRVESPLTLTLTTSPFIVVVVVVVVVLSRQPRCECSR